MKKKKIIVNFLKITTSNGRSLLSIEGRSPRKVEVVYRGEIYELSFNDSGDSFSVSIPIDDTVRGSHVQFIDDGDRVDVCFGIFSRLANLRGSYCVLGGFLFSRSRCGIDIRRYSRLLHFFREIMFLLRICVNIGLDKAKKTVEDGNFSVGSTVKAGLFVIEAIIRIPESLYLRITAMGYRATHKRKLWIVSDRAGAAGDNGEAFFTYIREQVTTDIDVFFAISRKSDDFSRIREIGPVIDIGSLKYKIMFLCADKIISSHADIETTNPFFRMLHRFVDILIFDFVFLQHGVIRHDHSEWLNKDNKNIKLFVTSAKREYDSIFTYPYHYTKNEVVLSGLPRFDYLRDNRAKKVIISPTYRANLLRAGTDSKGSRPYDPFFKKTAYFRFYNDFMNSKKLKDALKKYGYTIEFYIHPNFEKQRRDFTHHDLLMIPEYPYNYRKALSEGALLISDYSSITIDFAYMKKPIIYTKFDEDEFYRNHTYSRSDFFDDRRDGFGDVTTTLDELVDATIGQLARGCRMSDLYEERVDSFFYRIDHNNSRRVYEAIMTIDNNV